MCGWVPVLSSLPPDPGSSGRYQQNRSKLILHGCHLLKDFSSDFLFNEGNDRHCICGAGALDGGYNTNTSCVLLQAKQNHINPDPAKVQCMHRGKAVTCSGVRVLRGYLRHPTPTQSFPTRPHATSSVVDYTDSAVFPGWLP